MEDSLTTETVVETVDPVETYDETFVPETPNFDAMSRSPEVEDVGQVEGEVTPIEPRVVNIDDFQDAVFDLGDGTTIPASELKGGGLRQADYTRKTQEAAEIRRMGEQGINLIQALQNNPEGTLRWIASEMGVTLAEARDAVNQSQPMHEDNWWDDDEAPATPSPLDQRLAAIEQRFQQEDADRKVEQEFNRLKAKYGDEFDSQELAIAARDRGLYDPRYYEMVWKDLMYDKIQAGRQQALTESQKRQAAEEAARRAAAAEAAAATGAGASAVGENAPPPPRNLTTREAAELAWQQLGYE